ncbi:MAG: OmpA family protein [Candidatus Zixiibacteriota bacterium]|nr:MAG: OmpA family protein [candidate division Zixibacteria bacterium]
MSEESEQPIVVRKIKKGGHGGHDGSWKVAFADFMTAMMAFFLVMWMVGQKDEVKEAVAGYFRDPGKFQQQGKSGVLKGADTPVKAPDTNPAGTPIKKKNESAPTGEEKKQLNLTAKNILEELSKQQAFKRLKKNIKIHMTSEGLRIILNESEDAPAFFEPGSAKLLQKSAIILVTIAKELGFLSNRIVIEGHTDAGYMGDKVYGNWELSADRANSARQLMEVSGLWDGQIREVRGFSDQFPMIADNPQDPRNRRVSLVVLYQCKEAQYDELEVGEDLMAQVE